MTARAPGPDRCLTCGGSLPSTAPFFDHETGEMVTPEPYCSIHCEHYARLQQASAGSHAVHAPG